MKHPQKDAIELFFDRTDAIIDRYWRVIQRRLRTAKTKREMKNIFKGVAQPINNPAELDEILKRYFS